jgi:hypothetical protein
MRARSEGAGSRHSPGGGSVRLVVTETCVVSPLAAADISRKVNRRWPSEAESSLPTATELAANLAEAGKLVEDA